MTEAKVYFKNQLDGQSNDEIILVMYAELVKMLSLVGVYFSENELEKRVLTINKSVEVISALLSILNFDAGQVAFQLKSLYVYSIRNLTKANFDKDPRLVDEVLNIFKNLYEAWKEKIEKDRGNVSNKELLNGRRPDLPAAAGQDDGRHGEWYG